MDAGIGRHSGSGTGPARNRADLVRVERADGDEVVPPGAVAHVVLDRPDALNAISTEFARQLAAAFAALAADDDLRAVVLSSSSARAFCVGADLKERNGYSDEQLRAQRVVYRRMAAALLAVPVPVVAAVAGHALGGGLELALLSDLVVADETAVVGLPEVSVGVIPGLGGTQLLPRRIGAARAAELIFTARRIDAAEAAALGVVDRLVPAGEAVAAAPESRGDRPELAGRRPQRQACDAARDGHRPRRRRSRSRTPPGGRPPSPAIGPRACEPSPRSGRRAGRVGLPVRTLSGPAE